MIVPGVALALAGAGLSGGCASSRGAEIRANPTPELRTLDKRPVDTANSFALMRNENYRMMRQDMARAFYYDRPSRLTREPVPR